MTLRKRAPYASQRWLAVVVTLVIAGLLAATAVLAVHDDDLFELGPQGATTDILGDEPDPDLDANGPDWADIFDANGNPQNIAEFGGSAATFIIDDLAQEGAIDRTTFSGAGGSNKNNDPISTADCAERTPPLTGSACDTWHWDSGNVPAKDDLSNVYAYATFNSDDELIIYVGFERLAPEGDSHVDIEFLQAAVDIVDGAVTGAGAIPCNDPGRDTTPCEFSGIRTFEDVIISMDYVQGGGIGEVTVRDWDGNSYVQVGLAAGEGCNAADTICAFNNGGDIDGGPWPNFDRHNDGITDLPQNAFTEIGVNVTALLGDTPCISTIMGKTRSSASFTAELKDFAGPKGFNICGAQIGIAPDDVNEIGDDHTFTVTVEQKLGSTTSPAPDGTIVTVDLTDSNGAVSDISSDTCASPGTSGGTCSVTFTSDSAGTVTGHASADVLLGGETFSVETDGTGSNSGDATKRFVDASITIGPDDVNSIGESHTFTVNVQQDDGTTSGNAPDGTLVTVTLTGDADNVVDTCADPGTVSGECTVTFTSDTEGTVTAHAAVSLTFENGDNDVTVTRETDGTGDNSGDATKEFVDGSIAWTKVDNAGALQGGATFSVCRTHNLDTSDTEPPLTFVDITDVCVSVVDDVDGVAGGTLDEDPDPGEFLISGLRLGRYTVDETAAPPGFEPDPDVVTVELTLASPDATIATAFVNNRPIIKITEFGYTNAATGTPTAGITSGSTTYTVKLHNYGAASATLTASSLAITENSVGESLACTPASPVSITGTLAAQNAGTTDDLTLTVTCTYAGFDDGSQITATLNVSYILNGLTRVASGSPATITFTVQGD